MFFFSKEISPFFFFSYLRNRLLVFSALLSEHTQTVDKLVIIIFQRNLIFMIVFAVCSLDVCLCVFSSLPYWGETSYFTPRLMSPHLFSPLFTSELIQSQPGTTHGFNESCQQCEWDLFWLTPLGASLHCSEQNNGLNSKFQPFPLDLGRITTLKWFILTC